MKVSRPMTAPRDARIQRQQSKLTISGFKRPSSAKTQSLKQIIQVLENTLNQGAQNILLTKSAKTLQKFSRVKHGSDSVRRPTPKKVKDKDVPRYRTELFIANSTEFFVANSTDMLKSSPTINSAKQISSEKQNEEFTPYMKYTNRGESEEPQKQIKRVCRLQKRGKTMKVNTKAAVTEQSRESAIGGWNNESSLMNICTLLGGNLS